MGQKPVQSEPWADLGAKSILFDGKPSSFPSLIRRNVAASGPASIKIHPGTVMIFLSWGRPSRQEQNSCIQNSNVFNYDANFRGTSSKPASTLKQDKELSNNGFSVNQARVLVGSGLETFEKGKNALKSWKHFSLNWVFVDPNTPVRSGIKFCVCTKALFPWLMMPLEVVYVNKQRNTKNVVSSFSFGSGTLKGHLLAGEERFSITMDEKKDVWYEIVSFSKPAHFLSVIAYPYVLFQQKCFARESAIALQKHLSA